MKGGRRPVLLTVSGVVDPAVAAEAARGERPRPDYLVLAEALDAELLDVDEARRRGGRLGRIVERVAGPMALLAWVCFRELGRYRAIVTDGEQVGLPFAALARLRRRRPSHVMVAHILSVPKKRRLVRWLGLGRRIDAVIVYSSWQQRFVVDELGFPPERVALSPFMVDTVFFSPSAVGGATAEPVMVATAGLERRDYPTLIEAVRGLDVRVVVAAASNWSRRPDTTEGIDLPPNVDVRALTFVPLRQLYADARFVVMPLEDVEFQAGVTTILEAMAMAKPVICSRTRGQTDVIVDGRTGIYVPPGDPLALRRAIEELLADPDRMCELGAAARRYAEREADIEVYAKAVSAVVADAARLRPVPARSR